MGLVDPAGITQLAAQHSPRDGVSDRPKQQLLGEIQRLPAGDTVGHLFLGSKHLPMG